MATISSHILDSVSGDHAASIRIECYRRQSDGRLHSVFDVKANGEGRISETIDVSSDEVLQLHVYAQEYFDQRPHNATSVQIMPVIVIELKLTDQDAKYHVPIMLSPHAYSVWWSGKPVSQASA